MKSCFSSRPKTFVGLSLSDTMYRLALHRVVRMMPTTSQQTTLAEQSHQHPHEMASPQMFPCLIE